MEKINIYSRIKLVEALLRGLQPNIDNCTLAPSKTPNTLDYFGSISQNLTILEFAKRGYTPTREEKMSEEQIRQFVNLQNRYEKLKKDFTHNCECNKRTKPI